jgi:hypothetical protein
MRLADGETQLCLQASLGAGGITVLVDRGQIFLRGSLVGAPVETIPLPIPPIPAPARAETLLPDLPC